MAKKFRRCMVCKKKATGYESSPDGPWFFCSRKHYEEYCQQQIEKGLFHRALGYFEKVPDYFLEGD
jgi:hypothetical protein